MTEHVDYGPFFDALGAKPFGLTDKQVRFVGFIVAGEKQYRAAERAGYSAATEKGLSAISSRLMQNPKVKQLLSAATEWAEGALGEIAGSDEVRKMLTAEMRRGNLKAADLLSRIQRESEIEITRPPAREILDRIAKSPIGCAYACQLRVELGIEWYPPADAVERLQTHPELIAWLERKRYALDRDTQASHRERHAESINGTGVRPHAAA